MSEISTPSKKRHPIKNFILLPELQWPYIIRVLAMVNLSGVLMATCICGLFYLRYQTGEGVDPAARSAMSLLVEENLMDVVIPAFVISDVVSLAIGLWLALYFSRKISVPIYRVRQWAGKVSSGDLSYRLKFRPGDDLDTLEEACNEVGETYAKIIADLRKQLADADLPPSPRLDGIKSTLGKLQV